MPVYSVNFSGLYFYYNLINLKKIKKVKTQKMFF